MSIGSATTPLNLQTRKPSRCLVIQTSRLGDMFQSLMALRAAKQLYPELEIHFLTRDKFAPVARRVPWLQSVITLPTEKLLAPLNATPESEDGKPEAMAQLAQWMAPLVKDSWDFIVNWSYSESSSYLTAVLPGKVKLGFTRRRDISFACADGWSHYIQAVVQGGIDQNIHLTDILTTQLLTALQIHVGDPANDGNSPVTSKSFFSSLPGDIDPSAALETPLTSPHWKSYSNRWIGIQLGKWGAEEWAKLVTTILRRHSDCNIVLLGTQAEKSMYHQLVASLEPEYRHHSRLISLVGETDFDLWISIVGKCQWLFSGNDAAIHLASVLGTRVLNVSSEVSGWTTTGPYGNGHYVVSEKPSADTVYLTWSYAMTEWSHRRQQGIDAHAASLGLSESLKSSTILRSRIRATSDGGGVVYESLIRKPLSIGEWSSSVMGHIARAWYCGWVPPVGQELSRDNVDPSLIRRLRELDESLLVLHKICEQAAHTATWLTRRSSKLRSEKLMGIKDRQEIQDLGRKLLDLDRLAERLGNTQLPLKAFSQMSKVLMNNLRSDQLTELGRESSECYQQLKEGVGIFRDWVKYTLNLARPRVIQSVDISPDNSGDEVPRT